MADELLEKLAETSIFASLVGNLAVEFKYFEEFQSIQAIP
jgi:hypothetical protein